MKSYQIHFIRHGITESNLKGQYTGATDVSICGKGIEQLKKLSTQFDYPGAAVFYTSPLKRCIQTCDILYPGITPIIVNELAECNFGAWEGKTALELKSDEQFKNWIENAQNTPPPEGESGIEFAHRVCSAFEKIVQGMMKSGTTSAVIVTHGGVIMTILSSYGLPKAKPFDWMVDNGCGYSIRITPSLWMRGMVAEVYAKVPKDIKYDNNNEYNYII